jgi:hypothetical protein
MENFREVETVEEANMIDLETWKFVGLQDGKYIFAKRMRPLK